MFLQAQRLPPSAFGTNRKKSNPQLNPPPALLRKLFFVEEGNNLNLGFYVGIKYLSEKLRISHQLRALISADTPTSVHKNMCAFTKICVLLLATTQISV
jgi:hypothetical protein